MKFRKKPIIIEAIQWTGENEKEIVTFLDNAKRLNVVNFYKDKFEIETLEGTMTASKGDWIVRGISGELYPVKPDIFEKTYENMDMAEPENNEMKHLLSS